MEGDDPFGYTQPVNEKAYRMLEAKAKGGAGIVCLGEISPNHEYDKRFPFEPYVDIIQEMTGFLISFRRQQK